MDPAETHKVTIGIPTLNGPDRLDRCLRALIRHTPLGKHDATILVCDDGSREEAVEKNKNVISRHGIRMLMNQARLGVAESWNRLARHGIENYGSDCIVLLNDDVEVTTDWLDALVFSVRMNPHAGMVGLNAWQGINSDFFNPPPAVAYSEATMLHGHGMLASCGYCFAFAADKYKAVEGFDPRYFCFYEELSFGLSLLHKDWPSYMLSYPFVIHQGGATTSEPANVDAAACLSESREKFKSKWVSVEHQRKLFAGRQWPPCIHWNTALKRLED